MTAVTFYQLLELRSTSLNWQPFFATETTENVQVHNYSGESVFKTVISGIILSTSNFCLIILPSTELPLILVHPAAMLIGMRRFTSSLPCSVFYHCRHSTAKPADAHTV